jgi:geranylgeranyl transferase type-2 subunit beta
MSYLADLTLRLASSIAALPEDDRRRHAEYLRTAQTGDGGFAGRQGTGDLYYTSFALRALAMLGELDDATADRVARFLRVRLSPELPSIDFLSLATSAVLIETATGRELFAEWGHDRRRTVAEFFAPLRRGDGGYAKTPRGGQGSVYHTFLVAGCLEMVGAPPDEPERMVSFVRNRRRSDGGFVEVDALRHSGVNPTAAAVGLLRMLGGLDPQTAAMAAEFLAARQTPEGGLAANTRMPVGDLLSTFTGIVALEDLGALATINAAAALAFARSLEQPGGGFRAGIWDDAADVEYTFYGLGTVGLLAGM